MTRLDELNRDFNATFDRYVEMENALKYITNTDNRKSLEEKLVKCKKEGDKIKELINDEQANQN